MRQVFGEISIISSYLQKDNQNSERKLQIPSYIYALESLVEEDRPNIDNIYHITVNKSC